MPSEQVEVTQADRGAAADHLQAISDDGQTFGAIRRGQCDNDPLVQAFARHRIATEQQQADTIATLRAEIERLKAGRVAVLEEAAKVADTLSNSAIFSEKDREATCHRIAAAIRALAGDVG
jgi:alkylation response protein AidB-like acyl-CoA dehydrogenase